MFSGCIAIFPPDLRPAALRTHIDDEYASAGVKDPKVLVTTSRDPTQRLVQFAKVRTPVALKKCSGIGWG